MVCVCFNVEIKTLNEVHIERCGKVFKNPNVNSIWLTKIFMEYFRVDPILMLQLFLTIVMDKCSTEESVWQYFKTKKNALSKYTRDCRGAVSQTM